MTELHTENKRIIKQHKHLYHRTHFIEVTNNTKTSNIPRESPLTYFSNLLSFLNGQNSYYFPIETLTSSALLRGLFTTLISSTSFPE